MALMTLWMTLTLMALLNLNDTTDLDMDNTDSDDTTELQTLLRMTTQLNKDETT